MSGANLFASVLFSSIGLGIFIYGKKQSNMKCLGLGIALMTFPYFITNTLAQYLTGAALTALLFVFRD